ncbi:MAG: hypothetical protein P1U39_07665 [Legionellaceae bacterium]|nr:hypothetical protein [Legionellaceae bacterium]
MPINSLEKTLFLRRKLTESHNAITLPNNTRLNEILAAFDESFNQLIAQMEAIELDEILSQTAIDRDAFLTQLNLNRGDQNKRRFLRNDLAKRACIEDQISRLTKSLVETIEDENLCPALVEAYRNRHIYQMLYYNGVMGHYTTGGPFGIYHREKYPPLGPTIMKFAMVGLGFATLSVAFFATVALLGLNGGWIIAATALFGSAVAYMAGLLYGIINDIFATKANLPYFLLGHQATQHSFFISNDRFVQAIGWGIIAAQPIAIIAAIVFGVTIAAVMASAASPVLTFALPILLVVVPLFAACANVFANYSADKYIQKGISLRILSEDRKQEFRTALNLPTNAEWINLDQIDFDSESFRNLAKNYDLLNDYQLDGLALMSASKKDKANWLANNDRNLLGYIGTPLLAITGLVLMLTLTSVPVIFFSPLLSTIIPLVAAVIAIASLATALTYVSVNKEKQIDNRYKLFTSGHNGEKKIDELYITDVGIPAHREHSLDVV